MVSQLTVYIMFVKGVDGIEVMMVVNNLGRRLSKYSNDINMAVVTIFFK